MRCAAPRLRQTQSPIFFSKGSSNKACHRSDRQHTLFPSSVSLPCPRRHILLRAEMVQGFFATTRPPKTQGGKTIYHEAAWHHDYYMR